MPDSGPPPAVVRAAALVLVPDTAASDAAGWEALWRTIAGVLAERPAAQRRQFAVFLHALEWGPVLAFGSRFSRLSASGRVRVLGWLQDAPLLLLRRGFWGLKTLVLMGHYTRPESVRAIGYRATAAGWSARG